MQVGDSPLVGCGGYADDLAGAVRRVFLSALHYPAFAR